MTTAATKETCHLDALKVRAVGVWKCWFFHAWSPWVQHNFNLSERVNDVLTNSSVARQARQCVRCNRVQVRRFL